MLPVRVRASNRNRRRTASLAVLALAVGGSGGLLVASPATAATGNPAVPIFSSVNNAAGAGSNELQVVAADVNKDGFPDLVTAGNVGFTIELNNGSGGFAAPVVTPSYGTYSLAVGDVNGDGNLDVVTASGSSIFANLGTGTGAFPTKVVSSMGAASSPSPALGNFNGDAFLDLAVGDLANPTTTILHGDGTGKFTVASTVAAKPTYITRTADINGDGFSDVVSTQFNTATGVLLSNGTPDGFQALQSYTSAGLSPDIADFNGDGYLDVETAGTTPAVQLYTPTTGTFSRLTTAGGGGGSGIAAGDYNGDGRMDLSSSTAGKETFFLRTAAGGFFVSPVTVPAGGSNFSQVSADVNQDGKTDVVVMHYGLNYNQVLTNMGNAAPAVITTQPQDQTVPSGTNATFTAADTSTTPQSVQWQRSTDDGTTYANIAGATATTLTVVAPTLASNGFAYRAVFSNYGGDTISSPATLTVTATAPVITSQPANTTIASGRTGSFAVNFTGDPAPTVQWQLSTDFGSTFNDIAGATGKTYTTPPRTYADRGDEYRAVLTNSVATVTSNAAVLNVNAAAPVVTTQPSDRTAASGGSVTFTAVASADPAATVQWQLSTDGGANFVDISGATGTSYNTGNTYYADNGNQYRAVFTNVAGVTPSNAATLTNTGASPSVTTNPADQTVGSGGTATFTASATGDPAPTVQWQVSTDSGATFTNVAGETADTLSVTAKYADNGNLYRADYTNPPGSSRSQSAKLTVNPLAPTVTANPVDQTVKPGATATFSAAASGDPTPTVQWQVSTDNGGTFTDVTGESGPSITVTASTDQNQNQYRAMFSNTAGSSPSNSGVLTVTAVKPAVTTNPSAQVVNTGGTVSFTADASGDPTPTVQWQVSTDGGTTYADVAGAIAKTYTFTTSAGDTGNSYRAVFTNYGGTDVTTGALLTVNTAPQVTSQPADKIVNETVRATFTATADGSPTPTVQWRVSTDNGATFTDIAGATSGSYTTPSTAASDNGNLYQAVFTNRVGAVTTNSARLTVDTIPSVTTQPTDQSVNERSTATFTAAGTGRPSPAVQWQLSTDGGATFADIAGATSTSYTTGSTVAGDNSNQYRAIFSNGIGATSSNPATLTVDTAPTVTTQPTDQTVSGGSTATFTASATGRPTPTVQWQVRASGASTFTDIAGATSGSYTTPPTVASVNGNIYRAVFSNTVTTAASNGAVLTVQTVPVVRTQPADQNVGSGGTATFTAAATGDPAPIVQWQVSTDKGVTFTDVAGATDPTLQVSNVMTGDSGNTYRAVFTNAAGTVNSGTALLTVNPAAPTVTTDPSDQTVDPGAQVTFTADASGDPQPTVQWQVSADNGATYIDVTGETGTSYTLTASTSDTGNLYRALFSNAGGGTPTVGATLTVNPVKPTVTANPVGQTVNEGSTATFTADASGDPTPTVQWQISTDGGKTFGDIAGATATSISTGPTTAGADGNSYRAMFSNAGGAATTTAAILTVVASPVVSQTPPAAPRNVRATQSGPGQITITWDAPADSGTSPVTSYDVGYGNGRSGNGGSFPASARSAVFNGLPDGAYQASVGAISADGSGPRVFVPVTVTTVPGAPPAAPGIPAPGIPAPVPAAPVAVSAPAPALPFTGANTGDETGVAIGLLGLGALLARAGRRRRRNA